MGQHNILLRCLPAECYFQHVAACRFSISEDFWHTVGEDAFGNRIITGGTSERHKSLKYICEGSVRQSVYCIPETNPSAMYLYPSRLTELSCADYSIYHNALMKNDADKPVTADSFIEKCLSIMHDVHSFLEYAQNTTTISTTVGELIKKQKGVCQDYAHLMIAVCRKEGLMARYACGLMQGEGVTHAWVEVYDGQCWYAFDPTNDTAIAHGYIKIAHGRDALDCPVSRGMYTGNAIGNTEIKVKVIENDKDNS